MMIHITRSDEYLLLNMCNINMKFKRDNEKEYKSNKLYEKPIYLRGENISLSLFQQGPIGFTFPTRKNRK